MLVANTVGGVSGILHEQFHPIKSGMLFFPASHMLAGLPSLEVRISSGTTFLIPCWTLVLASWSSTRFQTHTPSSNTHQLTPILSGIP